MKTVQGTPENKHTLTLSSYILWVFFQRNTLLTRRFSHTEHDMGHLKSSSEKIYYWHWNSFEIPPFQNNDISDHDHIKVRLPSIRRNTNSFFTEPDLLIEVLEVSMEHLRRHWAGSMFYDTWCQTMKYDIYVENRIISKLPLLSWSCAQISPDTYIFITRSQIMKRILCHFGIGSLKIWLILNILI